MSIELHLLMGLLDLLVVAFNDGLESVFHVFVTFLSLRLVLRLSPCPVPATDLAHSHTVFPSLFFPVSSISSHSRPILCFLSRLHDFRTTSVETSGMSASFHRLFTTRHVFFRIISHVL